MENGNLFVRPAIVAGFLSMASLTSVFAADLSLEFDLVTTTIDSRKFDAPGIEGQSFSESKSFGVAIFKDGRYGTKEFISSGDVKNGAGNFMGYSTYNFQEGSITARYDATVGAQGFHGTYKILSGTGAYAGATGTGTLDSIPNPFKNSGLFKIKLQVKTP